MKNIVCLVVAWCMVSCNLHTHEGCHRAPGSLIAPHGGLIEETKLGYVVEVVNEEKEASIYVYDHDIHPIKQGQYSLKAIAIPQRKEPQEFPVKFQDDHSVVDTSLIREVSHYTLKIKLTIQEKNDEVDFVIEQ